MAFEHRDNSGSLFKNERREKDTHPHATGTAMIGGVLYEISAWTKEGRKGKFQSLSFKPKQERREPDDGDLSYGRGPSDMDDREIPF